MYVAAHDVKHFNSPFESDRNTSKPAPEKIVTVRLLKHVQENRIPCCLFAGGKSQGLGMLFSHVPNVRNAGELITRNGDSVDHSLVFVGQLKLCSGTTG